MDTDTIDETAENIAEHAETRDAMVQRLTKASADLGAGFRDLLDLVKGEYADDDDDDDDERGDDDGGDEDDQVGSDDMEKGGYVDATELFLKINDDLTTLVKARQQDAAVIDALRKELAAVKRNQQTLAKGVMEGFIGLRTSPKRAPEADSNVKPQPGQGERLAKGGDGSGKAPKPAGPEFSKQDLVKGMQRGILTPADVSHYQRHHKFDSEDGEHKRISDELRAAN